MSDGNFGIPRPIGTGLPDNQPFLMTTAAGVFVDAYARVTTAGEAFRARTAKRETRMITVPGLIALVTLLYCVFHGYIVSGVILAGLVGFGTFVIAAMIFGVIGKPVDPTAGQFTAIGVEEVKRSLLLMNRGRYQWVGRGNDFVGVFPDTGFVYYFGPATRWRHLLLAGQHTVRQVRVNATTQVSQTSTSTTEHGRRFAVAPARNVAILSKGKSTTTHQTSTVTHTSYLLEIQYQTGPGAQPAWLSVNFGTDGRVAEDWRLMIAQTAGLA